MKIKIVAIISIIIICMLCVGCNNTTPVTETPTEVEPPAQNTQIISSEVALDIALNKAQIERDDIKFGYIPLEYDDGKQIYEISFTYRDIEYDFDIDAQTGDIVEFSTESIYD